MTTRPQEGRPRLLRAVLITLAVLVALVIAAVLTDNIARGVAEGRVATQVQQELGLPQAPEVELGGTPFLAALVTREIPSATLRAADVPVEVSGKQVSVDTVHVTADRLVLGAGEVSVGSGTAEALIGYPALSTLAGVPVEAGSEPGRLQVSYTAELFGDRRIAVVSVVPVLNQAENRLELTQAEISIAGFSLSSEVAQHIIDLLVRPIDLELPYGLQAEAIEVESDGVLVSVTATDLTVPLD